MPCMFHEQCFDFPHAFCLNGNCDCIEGYSAHNTSKCLQGLSFNFIHGIQIWTLFQVVHRSQIEKNSYSFLDNVDIGESCEVNEQCRGTANSTVCENSTCTCTEGYISLGKHCYEGEIWNPQYKSEMVNKLSEFEGKGETFSLRNTVYGYKHKPIYNNFTRKINEYENVLFIFFS